jgi:hypothetical protein
MCAVLAAAHSSAHRQSLARSLAHPLAPTAAGGLVGVAESAVLPQIGSGATALWTLAAMAPCLLRLW